MEKDNTVRQAGGFIVQLMPNAEEEVIEKLEKNLAQITSVTELLDQGYTPEMLLEKLLGDMDLEINEKVPTSFYCNCDKVRVGKVLISLGEKELQGMIDDGENIELNCHFCNTNYTFSVEELKELLGTCQKIGGKEIYETRIYQNSSRYTEDSGGRLCIQCRGDSEADPADGNRGCKDHGISGALYHRIYLSGSVLADIASGQCERAADMAGKGDQSGGRADHCRPSMGI